MKIEWKRNHYIVLVILLLLLIALFTLGNRLWVAPVEEEVEQLEGTLENEEKLLTILKEKQNSNEVASLYTSRETQRKLPVLPVMDQLFIALERAQNSTGNLITSIGAGEASAASLALPEDDDVEETPETEEEAEESETGEVVDFTGLSEIQLSLQVTSTSFSELLSFLSELKNSERILSVKSIQFGEGDEERLQYDVTVASYYYPALTLLQDELPQYHYSTPSYKTNPLEVAQEEEEQPAP